MSEQGNPKDRVFTPPELAGAWCKGFNAYHRGSRYEECPSEAAPLQEQWREGWSNAAADDAR